MITIVAPAKINLFLRICGKTDAGYHLLDSAIAFTRFGDHLTIEPANDDQLAIIGEFACGLESADDNLVMTALNGFRAAGGVIGGLSITLEKNIPVGAGLGGGSADAAAFLRAVNALSSMPLGKDALYHLAASLGADVPVCLAGGCQRIAGIGETMTPIDLILREQCYWSIREFRYQQKKSLPVLPAPPAGLPVQYQILMRLAWSGLAMI
jgi:4-diphosphocytidyl-2-C-methyl-D-erythritol kinase